MRKQKDEHAKVKKSDKRLTNFLLDEILTTGVFQSPVKESFSSEVEKLLEEF